MSAPTPAPPTPRNVVELFDQGHWWRAKDGQWLAIGSMAPEYRYNTTRMLERHAAAYQLRYEMAWLSIMTRLAIGDPDGDDWFIADATTWLRRTALFRALQAHLPTSGKRLRRLAERAHHWATCPMRLRRSDRPADATCCCAEFSAPTDSQVPLESEVQ